MNVLVIGHLSIDLLEGTGGAETRQYGGIARAVTTLGALLAGRDQVVPVAGVPASEIGAVSALFSAYPSVSTAGLFTSQHPLPRIPAPGVARAAHGHAPQPPIPFEKIRRHLSADWILINMVSGNDITLETLDEIRMAVRERQVPIHLDLHNLTRRVSGSGGLTHGPVELWRRWAFMVDTVQMNEQEIASLTVERLPEAEAAGHLLTLGPQAVLVTRGARGVSLYRNDRKRVVRDDIPGVPGREATPGLGCGDIFGAAVVARRGAGDDPPGAARAATVIAAEHCAGEAAAMKTTT